jgi:CheY-like chemotaxis protein
MKLTCVLCSKEYIFDADKIPDQGFRISCSSCNTKFTVHLPEGWREVLLIADDELTGEDTTVPGDEKFIMLADDTAFFRALMTDILTKEGYHVKTASDGQQALDIFNASPSSFKLILLDLQMPKISGFTVLEELNKLSKMDISVPPVIVMTGVHDSHEDIKIVRELGAQGFVDKSLDPAVALERINMVLEGQKVESDR